MKKAIIGCILLALIAAGSAYSVGRTSKVTMPRRVAKLERQVRLLNRSVGALKGIVSCLGAPVAVSEYGNVNANGSDGYLYTNQANETFYTTALDVTTPGDTTDGYMATISVSCIGAKAATRHGSGSARQTSGLFRARYSGRWDHLRTLLGH